MRLIGVFATMVAMLVCLAQAQNYHQLFAGFGPYLTIRQQPSNSLQSLQSLQNLQSIQNLQSLQMSRLRDPRSNTGPVLFPPGPPGNPADTSGVIVGASGYGFVPPNAAFFTYFY